MKHIENGLKLSIKNQDTNQFNNVKAECVNTKLQKFFAKVILEEIENAAKNGYLEIVEWLLGLISLKLIPEEAIPIVLFEAVKAGQLEVLNWLWDKYLENLKEDDQVNLIKDAICIIDEPKKIHLEVLNFLLSHTPIAQKDTILKHIAEHALKNVHLEVLKWIWSQLTEENKDSWDYKAFRKAVKNGHLEIVKWIWERASSEQKSAIIEDGNYYGFREAAGNGHLEIVELIWQKVSIEQKLAMIEAQNYYGFREAARNGHLEIVKWIWEKASHEQKSTITEVRDYYAFSEALGNGHLEIVEWIWEKASHEQKSAMIEVQNYQAFKEALQSGYLEIVEWIWEKASREQKSAITDERDLFNYVTGSDKMNLAILEWLWQQVTDEQKFLMIQAKGYDGFQNAVVYGKLEIVKFLWKEASSEQRNSMIKAQEFLAIRSAVVYGNLEILEFLWEKLSIEQKFFIFDKYDLFAKCKKDGIIEQLLELVIDDKERFEKAFKEIPTWYSEKLGNMGIEDDKEIFKKLIQTRVELRELGFNSLKIEEAIVLLKNINNFMTICKNPAKPEKSEKELFTFNINNDILKYILLQNVNISLLDAKEIGILFDVIANISAKPENCNSRSGIEAQSNFMQNILRGLKPQQSLAK